MYVGLASARRLSTIAQTALLETPDASTSALQSPRKPLEGPATTARGEHEVANEAEAGAADPIRDQGRRDRLLVIANAPGKRKSEGKSLTLRSTPIVPAQKLAERAEPVVRSESQPEEQEPDSASNKQQQAVKPRRRKRTSIGKIPKKRKQSIVTTREGEIEEEEPEEEALPAQERVLAMPRRAQTLLKRALATVEEGNHEEDEEQQAEEDHEEDHEEDNEHEKAATKFLKHYSRPPKPRGVTDQSVRRRSRTSNKHFNGRRGGTVDADTAVAEEPEIPSTRRKNRESVPITVHRLSTVGKGEDEGNVLIGPPPFPKRNGVNAVDVLGQVCRELIANAVEKLQQDAEKQRIEAGKGEWKRKRKAVMAFGAELDSRLFDMVRPPLPHDEFAPNRVSKCAYSLKHLTTIGRSQ